MKGQMFIITMIFLVGLIFVVQGNLAQYTFLDLAKVFEKNDLPLLTGIKASFRDALATSWDCREAGRNLEELRNALDRKVIGGTAIEVSYALRCPQKALNMTIHLKSVDTDTLEQAVM